MDALTWLSNLAAGERPFYKIRRSEPVIEAALYRMPQVADAALVAMPDARLQERACAFVTLRAGQALDLERVCQHLARECFTKHFWPERLEVLAEMPRTATGKVQKFVLRELAKALRPQSAEARAASLE